MAIVVKRTIVGSFPTCTSLGIAAGFSLSQMQRRLSLAFRGLVECLWCLSAKKQELRYMLTQPFEA